MTKTKNDPRVEELLPAPKDKVYSLPAEVVAALATGRTALLIPLRNRINNGQPPTSEEWLSLVELCVDTINDRRQERDAHRRSQEALLEKLHRSALGPMAKAVAQLEAALEQAEQEAGEV